MKTLQVNRQTLFKIPLKHFLIPSALICLWFALPHVIINQDSTAALLDPGIWQLLLLSIICFFGLTFLSWNVLAIAWSHLGLKPINSLILNFNELNSWQQLGFYWASFALLLLAGIACLASII